jgi:serine phosphatase RsbU (regulator of sigma subunit)/pSer/pThr/pTyr-binding forkhead associated (FHA) protein
MPWLEIHREDGQSHRVPIKPGAILRVGRAPANDVALADDSAVSRFHAEFTFDGERCSVRDSGSRNGTFVDRTRIDAPTTFASGTWVHVGKTRIRLVTAEEPVSATDEADIPPPDAAATDSVMLSVSEIVNSAQLSERPSPQLRAFATLSKASNALLSQRPLAEVLELVVDLAHEIAAPDRCAVLLLQGDSPELRTAASRGLSSAEGERAISHTIADLVLEQQQSVLTTDASMDDRFVGAASVMMQKIRSAMCVPLWNNKQVIGLVYVDTQGATKRFSKDDLEALTLVANVAAVKIDNVRLFQQEQRMKEIERELRAAARIQQRLLPAEPPPLPGYEVCGHNKPCFEVGGDYFDHLLRDEGTLAVALGDVSGKGMGAALLMASIQASFHAHAGTDATVEQLVTQLNRAVCRSSEAEKFSTFFYGEVELATGSLRYCNAGHNPPLLVRASSGDVELLTGGGMILGFLPDVEYTTREVRLEPGDLLVVYSDGVTESVNLSDEEFGEQRLIDVVRSCTGVPLADVRRRIDEAAAAFVGEADPFDDSTLLLLRRGDIPH